MLSDQLKEKTKIAHQELEKLLILKIKSIKSANDYINILIQFYIFFGPLEKEIFSHIVSSIPNIHERRKTKSIVDDLRFFGSSPPNIISNHCIPPIRDYLQALGAMYVLEGSTLGGKIITKIASKITSIQKSADLK
jgi:heme oxygenase